MSVAFNSQVGPRLTLPYRGLLLNQKAISLILTCWTHMSAPSRDDVNALIHELYEECGGCNPTSVDPQRHMRAVHVLGVDTLVQRFEGWLTVSIVTSLRIVV